MHLFRNTISLALADFIISELEKMIKNKSESHNLLKAANSCFPNLWSMKAQFNPVYEFLKNCLGF